MNLLFASSVFLHWLTVVYSTNHPHGSGSSISDINALFSLNSAETEQPRGSPPVSQTPSSSSQKATNPPQSQNPQIDSRSNGESCEKFEQNRLFLFQDSVYFISLLDAQEQARMNDWFTARKYCQFYCMDLVAIESAQELGFLSRMLDKVAPTQRVGVWTSGFFCPSGNCTSLPYQQTPWVYTSTGGLVPSVIWSKTGEASLAQPDNYYHRVKLNTESENCMGLLRNWYNDGCVAHDLPSRQLLGVACEAKLQQPGGMVGNDAYNMGQGMIHTGYSQGGYNQGMTGYNQKGYNQMMSQSTYSSGQGMLPPGYPQGLGIMSSGAYIQGQGNMYSGNHPQSQMTSSQWA